MLCPQQRVVMVVGVVRMAVVGALCGDDGNVRGAVQMATRAGAVR